VPKRNSVYIGSGSRISVGKNGRIKFGVNFCNTAMGTICCVSNVTLGRNVLTSWNTLIMDTDWHSIQDIKTLEIFPKTKPISIGNNVWIGTRAVILKGGRIPDGCIVGANSLITKQFDKNNAIIAGNPAKVLKENVRYIE
jgi:acetyltransferase-like isoleucine patch superfamily enzyme